MKKQYLVVHDYGTGGVWAIISARSEEEICEKYPGLKIVNDRPAWMSDMAYENIRESNSFDIDATPAGWLARLHEDK
jgi:hypothetical protein